MENNWPETIDELMEECQMLVGKNDLYELGKRGEPFAGEYEPRVDGTEYLAGEYLYGVAMIPAQWVTHVIDASTLGSNTKGCENLLWELVGALDVAYATDSSEKPIVREYARRIVATMGGGKLTAEQVREVVEKHWHDLPAEYDMPEASALPEYSHDWQAIADDLNAIGGGECELTLDGTDGCFGCSECLENIPPLANFCPNCGKRVRKAVKHG